MRCAAFYGKGDLRVEEWPTPCLGPFEALIKVSVCGFCHGDLLILDGSFPVPPPPFVLGHEYSGIVVELGQQTSTLQVGDHVAILPVENCGHCSLCRRGLHHLCVNRRGIHGGFAEYASVHERLCYRLPEGTSDLAGSMVENVNTSVHAVDQANLSPGDQVVVVGGGPIGLTLIQVLRLAGASRIIVSEPNKLRRDLALELGADVAVDPANEELERAVNQSTGSIGADIAFEVVGSAKTVEQCVHLVRRGGTVVLVGVSVPDVMAKLSPFELLWREITLRGAIGPGLSFERSVRLLPALSLERLMSDEFQLEDIHRALDHRRIGVGLKAFVRL